MPLFHGKIATNIFLLHVKRLIVPFPELKISSSKNLKFEVNECFDVKNSAFDLYELADTFVILFVKYKLFRKVQTFTCVCVRVNNRCK